MRGGVIVCQQTKRAKLAVSAINYRLPKGERRLARNYRQEYFSYDGIG